MSREKLLVVYFNGCDNNCEYNHGFSPETFLVTRKLWKKICKNIEEHHDPNFEDDFTDGGHGCIIDINFREAIQNCKILEENPSDEIIAFVKKIQSTRFIDDIQKFLDTNPPKKSRKSRKEIFRTTRKKNI